MFFLLVSAHLIPQKLPFKGMQRMHSNFYRHRMGTPHGVAGRYQNMGNRINPVMEELRKQRHREAQKRYLAKKRKEHFELESSCTSEHFSLSCSLPSHTARSPEGKPDGQKES